jgi:hypothetical protein
VGVSISFFCYISDKRNRFRAGSYVRLANDPAYQYARVDAVISFDLKWTETVRKLVAEMSGYISGCMSGHEFFELLIMTSV